MEILTTILNDIKNDKLQFESDTLKLTAIKVLYICHFKTLFKDINCNMLFKNNELVITIPEKTDKYGKRIINISFTNRKSLIDDLDHIYIKLLEIVNV